MSFDFGGPSPISLAQSIIGTATKFASGDTLGGALNLLLGSQIGGLVEELVGGKPSNDSAYAVFTAGPIPRPFTQSELTAMGFTHITGNVGGTEASTQTRTIANTVTALLNQIIQAYAQRGIRFNNPIFAIEVGDRDPASIVEYGFSSGKFSGQTNTVASNEGMAGDVAGTAMDVWQWLSQYATPSVEQIDAAYAAQQATPVSSPGTAQPTAPASPGTAQPLTTQASSPIASISSIFQQYGTVILWGGIGLAVFGLLASLGDED